MSASRLQTVIQRGLVLLLLAAGGAGATVGPKPSVFEQVRHQIRYDLSYSPVADEAQFASAGQNARSDSEAPPAVSTSKSPAKAFLLSLAIPGLGQYYYGSRVKPFIFIGIEISAWVLNIRLNNDGDDITAEFEAFNRAHWIRDNYEQKYLAWNYGGITDDDLIEAQEISHHLPDTRTQQYYEMTGKYDQFSWGWDDANVDGKTIDDYSAGDPPPKTSERVPYSTRRFWYEQRRDDANGKYDLAKKMIAVSMINHLVSAFEAYFATKKRNDRPADKDTEFARIKVRAELKTQYSRYDTPFLKLTYKF
ncbi:MAG: hypothetical protein OEW00_01375 [candidate division Zixibacteria bacterium]|nr:hypothetical protein [candidate division Zixibacteria bacterium]